MKKNGEIMPKYKKFEKLSEIGYKKSLLILYNLFLAKIDQRWKRSVLLSRPITLQLEPTTKCNLRCSYCVSPIWDRKGKYMTFSDFKMILGQFPFLGTLLLQGIGEPLLCKDFFQMIEYCKHNKIIVGITTNGTLLDKQTAKKIVDLEMDYMIISVDGARSETFEESRIGAKFEHVIGNIVDLIKVRGGKKKPIVIFLFTATRDNIHELPSVLKLAKDIGIDRMEAQSTHFWDNGTLKERINDMKLSHDLDTARKIVNKTIMVANEIGMPFNWLGIGGRKSIYSDKECQLHADQRLCQMPFRSCFITVDGYVTTCPCTPDPRKFNFGNVLKQDFKTIWNSPNYIELRKARKKGEIPDYCRTCTVPHI